MHISKQSGDMKFITIYLKSAVVELPECSCFIILLLLVTAQARLFSSAMKHAHILNLFFTFQFIAMGDGKKSNGKMLL